MCEEYALLALLLTLFGGVLIGCLVTWVWFRVRYRQGLAHQHFYDHRMEV